MKLFFCCAVVSLAGFVCEAKPVNLFLASAEPVETWGWGEARVDRTGDALTIKPLNAAATHGDVFVDQRFPVLPGAEIVLDVVSVLKGVYTLQVLGFNGDTLVSSGEPVKDSVAVGERVIKLDALGLKPEVNSILFKVWVAHGPGVALVLRDLAYRLPDTKGLLLHDLPVGEPTQWFAEDVALTADSDGLTATLADGKSFGAFTTAALVPREQASHVLVQVGQVVNANLVVQGMAFDEAGRYLNGVEAGRTFATGWHAFPLRAETWPEGTVKIQPKIWIEGTAGASATLGRVLILSQP